MSAITISPKTLAGICQRHHVSWLAAFGSVARGEARPDSDVDLLVEFDPSAKVTYFDLEGLATDLSPLFEGRRVDLGQPRQLHWYIRDRILKEAHVLYAR